MTRIKVAIFGVMFAAIASGKAVAQDAPFLRANHFTLNAGMIWSGPYDVGDATARLRGNGTGAIATPFTLFISHSRFTMAFAPEVRVGYAVTRYFAVDGGVSYSRPRVAVAIAGDPEAPKQDLAGERLDQYQIDARVTWQLPVHIPARAGPLAPFIAGGGGYLRQLHEDHALAETGWIYHAGGGVRYWLHGGAGNAREFGVRAEGRFNVRTGGIDFDNARRYYPSVSIMVFIGL